MKDNKYILVYGRMGQRFLTNGKCYSCFIDGVAIRSPLTWTILVFAQASLDAIVYDNGLIAGDAAIVANRIVRSGAADARFVAIDALAKPRVSRFRTLGHAVATVAHMHALQAIGVVGPSARLALRITLAARHIVRHRVNVWVALARAQTRSVELNMLALQALSGPGTPAASSRTLLRAG